MIGFVEIQDERPVLHTFEKINGGYSFFESREFQDNDAYLAGLIEKLDRVFFGMPVEDLHFRVLKLPFTDRKKVEDIIPMQLEGMVSDSIKNIVYDFLVLGKADDQYRIAVAFSLKEAVRKYIDLLSGFGVRPEVITSVEGFSAFSADSLESLFDVPKARVNGEERLKLMAEMIGTDTVNLAKGEFSFRKAVEKARSLFRVTIALYFVVCVLLGAHFLIDMGNASKRERELKKEMTKLYTALIPDAGKVVDPLYQLRSKVKQIKGKKTEINDVHPLRVLESIARTWVAGRAAEGVKVSGDLITVSGEAQNAEEVSSIADVLETEFGVKPVIETKQVSGGKTGYTLQIRKADLER